MRRFTWKILQVDKTFANVDGLRAYDNFEQLVLFEEMQIELFEPFCSWRWFGLVLLVTESARKEKNLG